MPRLTFALISLLFSVSAFATTTVEILPGGNAVVNATETVEVTCKGQSQLPLCRLDKSFATGVISVYLDAIFWGSFPDYNSAVNEVVKLRKDSFCR